MLFVKVNRDKLLKIDYVQFLNSSQNSESNYNDTNVTKHLKMLNAQYKMNWILLSKLVLVLS